MVTKSRVKRSGFNVSRILETAQLLSSERRRGAWHRGWCTRAASWIWQTDHNLFTRTAMVPDT